MKVRMIRSDNALGLGKGTQEVAFLASEGILHQLSCVATRQQNGIVERKHRHLLEIARGLMFHSRLPMPYWGESILTVTHLLNRFPSSVLKGKTPYEILFQQNPKYGYLRNFGCLCYASTLAITIKPLLINFQFPLSINHHTQPHLLLYLRNLCH